MADRKISDLTALTTPASGDYLPIVDISEASAANKNKRITVEELLRGAPDGTAGAPGIAFESDPDTGIYSPGADAFGVVTAGTERLRLTSTGELKHIGGGSEGSPAVYFAGSAPINSLYVQPTTGYVGLGTSSPETTLTVRGEIVGGSGSSITGTTLLKDFYATGASLGTFGVERSTGSPVLTANLKQAENAAGYVSTNTLTAGKSVLKLASTGLIYATAASSSVPIGNAVTLTDRFTITNEGNVGVGTTSPSSLLHLADAGDITVGTTTGTKIGTATTQKLGFWNATPVVQPAAVADATDAASVITQLNDLLAKLRTLGIIAT